MFDERLFIHRVESANTEDFVKLLRHPSADEELALRNLLGDTRYQRLHGAVLRRSLTRSRASEAIDTERGNVVLLHGIMGAELSSDDHAGHVETVWLRMLSLLAGHLLRLALAPDGRSELNSAYEIRATGILKRYYGELLLALSENWNVRAFWYDWRKDLDIAATELHAKLDSWFGPNEPVHLVAHSMGGLVARSFISKYRDRWESMQYKKENNRLGGRLIMIGTPNYGSFDIVQALAGIDPVIKRLRKIYILKASELQNALNTFVGTYQMLPSPFKVQAAALYDARTYRNHCVAQPLLDNARRHHEWLRDNLRDDDKKRMVYIAGYNQPTASGLAMGSDLNTLDSYSFTTEGDGRVPHELGRLENVDTFYVEENHGALASNRGVINAMTQLLNTGTTDALLGELPRVRAMVTKDQIREKFQEIAKQDENELLYITERLKSQGMVRGSEEYLPDERQAEDALTRGVLSGPADEFRPEQVSSSRTPPVELKILLFHGGIETEFESRDEFRSVDAIAVGHYIGVRPSYAELDLDRAVSSSIRKGVVEDRDKYLITQFTDRGLIRGDLGLSFLVPDPRKPNRVIAIAGMGLPGRFGAPEAAVLWRELCWSLGRMGKRHLATVLIGSGFKNLSISEAVAAWLRGIRNAVAGSHDDGGRLETITFCEKDKSRINEIRKEICDQAKQIAKDVKVDPDAVHILEAEVKGVPADGVQSAMNSPHSSEDEVQIRITLELTDDGVYRFGAITGNASVPERESAVDQDIVDDANDELAKAPDLTKQFQAGRFLEQFLMPPDLREHLRGNTPIVMLLDARTARIHWEMLAQPGAGFQDLRRLLQGERIDNPDTFFLAIGRGFTRQFRSTFATPPDPPPPPKQILRALVVADPAADAHLEGAEEEGVLVADLLETFNAVHSTNTDSRVAVKRLLGPLEATRFNVLSELLLRSYDILHFAGHCIYDDRNKSNSGWIFSNNERLTAKELSRLDRVPKFVFSNACESGVTTDRPELRSADLAPSFAESFFARGVSNFVCTAWPISDVAAREFALRIYSGMFGLKQKGSEYVAALGLDGLPTTEVVYVAMREARLKLAREDYGVRTWGAYQHYGNPYFRFFDSSTFCKIKPTQQDREMEMAPAA